jgi:hypothetical protein
MRFSFDVDKAFYNYQRYFFWTPTIGLGGSVHGIMATCYVKFDNEFNGLGWRKVRMLSIFSHGRSRTHWMRGTAGFV